MDGATFGTSWHGVLEGDELRRAFLERVAHARGRNWVPGTESFAAIRERHLDRLGDLVEEHLDTDALLALIERGAPAGLRTLQREQIAAGRRRAYASAACSSQRGTASRLRRENRCDGPDGAALNRGHRDPRRRARGRRAPRRIPSGPVRQPAGPARARRRADRAASGRGRLPAAGRPPSLARGSGHPARAQPHRGLAAGAARRRGRARRRADRAVDGAGSHRRRGVRVHAPRRGRQHRQPVAVPGRHAAARGPRVRSAPGAPRLQRLVAGRRGP